MASSLMAQAQPFHDPALASRPEPAHWALDPLTGALAGSDDDGRRAFLRMVSHELRTPLNSIIGFAELMRAEPYGPLGAPAYVEYAGIIRDSGAKLLSLFNSFIEIMRLEGGSHGYEPALEPLIAGDGGEALYDQRDVFFDVGFVPTRLYRRDLLSPGDRIGGPAMITEYTSATVLPPGSSAQVDGFGNLVITVLEGESA